MTHERLAEEFHHWAVSIGTTHVGDMGLSARFEIEAAIDKRHADIADFAAYLREQKLNLSRYWPNGLFAPPDFEAGEIDFPEDSFEWRLFGAITCAAREIEELKSEIAFRREGN